MAVVAKMVSGTIQFHPQTAADNTLADYLADAVNRVKRQGLAKSASAAALLESQAEVWDGKSRDMSLAKEVRDYNAVKAGEAREQAKKLSAL